MVTLSQTRSLVAALKRFNAIVQKWAEAETNIAPQNEVDEFKKLRRQIEEAGFVLMSVYDHDGQGKDVYFITPK